MQAELGGAADEEQEDYRGYLLQRVLPAARHEERMHFPNDGSGPAYNGPTHDFLASCSTGELEASLAGYYDRLLMVRLAALFECRHLEGMKGLASSYTGLSEWLAAWPVW